MILRALFVILTSAERHPLIGNPWGRGLQVSRNRCSLSLINPVVTH